MEVEDRVLVVAFCAAFVRNFGLELIDLKFALGFTFAVLYEVSLEAVRIKTAGITLLDTWNSILVATIVIEIHMVFIFLLSLLVIRSNTVIFKLINLADMALKLQRFLDRDELVLEKEFRMH